MSALSRAEEDTLKILREKEEKQDITEDEDLIRSMLEDKYSVFLEEGVRKLREEHGSSSPKRRVSMFFGKLGIGNGPNGGASSSTTTAGSSRPEGSAVVSDLSGDGIEERQTPTFVACAHWNWISTEIIVGAIPYSGTTQDKAAHLLCLRDQLHREKSTLSVVLSCLEDDELVPTQQHDWAQPKDWESILQTTTFLNIPLPADQRKTIELPFTEMLQACSQVYAILHPALPDDEKMKTNQTQYERRAAYIHCKAGRGRSWVVAMCYLTSQEVMSYETAEAQIKKFRPTMKPTQQQIEYVQEFVEFSAAPIAKKKEEEEEQYFKVLADILQLQPKYRQRLMRDLAKLT